MTVLSARNWVEMNRTDVAHLFRWVYPPQNTCQKIKNHVSIGRFYSKMEVYILENGLKWVVVARYGLKLWENEATRFRIIFKPEFWLKIQPKNKKLFFIRSRFGGRSSGKGVIKCCDTTAHGLVAIMT